MSSNYTGKCLCGSVSVTAAKLDGNFHACHCGMCQTWMGGPFLTVEAGNEVTFQGKESITRFSSSAWAERGFCSKCGTHLFYYLKPADKYWLPLRLLGNTEHFKFEQQIFIDKKPSGYTFSQKTETMTEAEFMAKYGG